MDRPEVWTPADGDGPEDINSQLLYDQPVPMGWTTNNPLTFPPTNVVLSDLWKMMVSSLSYQERNKRWPASFNVKGHVKVEFCRKLAINRSGFDPYFRFALDYLFVRGLAPSPQGPVMPICLCESISTIVDIVQWTILPRTPTDPDKRLRNRNRHARRTIGGTPLLR